MKQLTPDEWEEYKEDCLYKSYFSIDQLNELIGIANGIKKGNIKLLLRFDEEYFKDDGSKHDGWLVANISRREALDFRINQAAEYALSPPWRRKHDQPLSALLKKVNVLKNSCQKLEKILANKNVLSWLSNSAEDFARKQGDYRALWPDLEPIVFPEWSEKYFRGNEAVKRSITTINYLLKWALSSGKLLENEVRKSKSKKSPHKGKEHIQEMTEELCCIWRDIFGRELKTSTHGTESATKGDADGPFVRFVVYSFSCLNTHMTKGAARMAIRSAKKRLAKRKDGPLTLDDILSEPLHTN